MSQFTVRTKSLWQRMQMDRFVGRAERSPGISFYVLPTTDYASYDADAFVRNQNEFVYNTMALALAACVAGRGDNIVLLPGVHNVATASLAMSKAGVKIWGPEAWMDFRVRQSAAILTTDITGDEIMNVTAPDCGIIGASIRPITASDAIDLTAAADGFVVDRCHFDLYTPAVSTSTIGITCAAARDVFITNSVFISDGAQGNAIVATGLIDSEISHCRFIVKTGTWASVILCGAATTELEISHCSFLAGDAAISDGVNGTGATITSGVHVYDCRFSDSVSKPLDGFGGGEAELAESYKAGDGGGDGGVLVTAIT